MRKKKVKRPRLDAARSSGTNSASPLNGFLNGLQGGAHRAIQIWKVSKLSKCKNSYLIAIHPRPPLTWACRTSRWL